MGLFNFNRTNSTDDILPAETSDENSVNKDELKKLEAELEQKKEILEAKLEEVRRKINAEENQTDTKPTTQQNENQETVNIEEYNNIKGILEQRNKEVEILKDKVAQLSEENKQLREKVTTPSEQFDTTQLTEELSKLQKSIKSINNSIIEENARLSKDNENLQSKLDSKQERLEEIMSKCQEDRYRKDKSKLINRIIYQSDLLRHIIYETETQKEKDLQKLADFLLQQLVEINKYMETTLIEEGLECIQEGKDGATLNLDYQEVIRTVPTDNPELAGKIHRSINPGYVWKLPYILKAKINDDGSIVSNYRYLIRPEQVITYKLNN
ncbi:MAG: hypothetical protein IKU01_03815 [Bacteroidales bacterium]|nr:hypothetical protein [Bacteroidales bacterium]